jgi:hypothetical protein
MREIVGILTPHFIDKENDGMEGYMTCPKLLVNNASYLLAELEPMSGLQVSVIYTSDVYE